MHMRYFIDNIATDNNKKTKKHRIQAKAIGTMSKYLSLKHLLV